MKKQFNEMCKQLYIKLLSAASKAGDTLKNEKVQSVVKYSLIIVVICATVVISIGIFIFHEQMGEAFNRIMEICGSETIG
ncbi:hypothetical protein QUF75_10730 [Desulfococcaceae bacterium HSG7]|nr:hypothetical protein [Desulfococcaceae bacterium HSG7]